MFEIHSDDDEQFEFHEEPPSTNETETGEFQVTINLGDIEEETFNLRESPEAKRERTKKFKKTYFGFDTSDPGLREGAVNSFFKDEVNYDANLTAFAKPTGKEDNSMRLCLRNVKRTATSFTCLDCGLNQNAMICGECFDVARHKGHRVMKINRSGVCDCGDVNMWKKEGNCSKHTGN